MKWLFAIIFGIAFVSILFVAKDRKLHILRLMAFCIPFQVGFLYTGVLAMDLFSLIDLFLLMLLVLWFYESNAFRKRKIYWGKAIYPAVALIIWITLSLLPAISQLATGFGVFVYIKVLVLYLYLVNQINTKRELQVLVNWLLVGLLFQGFLGTLQKLTGASLGLYFLGERSMNFRYLDSRVHGTFGFPNQYGAYLILLLPVAISLFAFSKKKTERLWYGAICSFGLIALFFSMSRSSWIGMVIAILTMLLRLAKQKKLSPKIMTPIILVVIAMLVLAIVFWDNIIARMEGGEKGEYRMIMIEIAIPMALNNPIFGVGLNNYQWHSYHLFTFWHPVHNEYLRLACEIGFPGLFFFLWFVFVTLKQAYRITKLKDKYLSALGLGIFGGHVAFLIAILFGPEYQHYRQKFTFWLLAGLVFCIPRIVQLEKFKLQRLLQKKQILSAEIK